MDVPPPHEAIVLLLSSSIMGWLGALGSILLLRKYRSNYNRFVYELIMFRTLVDLVYALHRIVEYSAAIVNGSIYRDDALCLMSGMFFGTFMVGQVAFHFAFCYYLHKLAVRRRSSHVSVHIVGSLCLGIPLVFHVVPLFSPPWVSYSPAGSNGCYIGDDHPVFQAFFMTLPTVALYTLVLALYFIIVIAIIRRTIHQSKGLVILTYGERDGLMDADNDRALLSWASYRRLVPYPGVFLVMWLPRMVYLLLATLDVPAPAKEIALLASCIIINVSSVANLVYLTYNTLRWSYVPDAPARHEEGDGSSTRDYQTHANVDLPATVSFRQSPKFKE